MVRWKEGKYEEAKQFLEQAITMLQGVSGDVSHLGELASCYLFSAQVLEYLGNREEAFLQCQRAEEIAAKLVKKGWTNWWVLQQQAIALRSLIVHSEEITKKCNMKQLGEKIGEKEITYLTAGLIAKGKLIIQIRYHFADEAIRMLDKAAPIISWKQLADTIPGLNASNPKKEAEGTKLSSAASFMSRGLKRLQEKDWLNAFYLIKKASDLFGDLCQKNEEEEEYDSEWA